MYSQAKMISKQVGKVNFLTPVKIFMISTMIVNGGNYLYNLVLGRALTPSQFSEAAIMITLLLVFSFLAMTFQIVATKFTVAFEGPQLDAFKKWITNIGLKVGFALAILFIVLNNQVTEFFQLSNQWVIIVFALAMPFYFVMSVKRGFLQGKEDFTSLSASYQAEVWIRFVVTVLLIFLVGNYMGLWVSVSILVSVLAGLVIIHEPKKSTISSKSFEGQKLVWKFFLLTAGYECAQILINYSDILLVKHYFSNEEAGLYTSMALIGRMIYFITWMIVMVLIPKVLNMKKRGEPFQKMMLQYFFVILGFSTTIVLAAFVFPNQIVLALFGEAYLPVSSMLWMYALATMFFALANLFVYYFLSLDERRPVYIAIIFGLIQLALLAAYHGSLRQMIWVQIINMGVLLAVQVGFFVRKS